MKPFLLVSTALFALSGAGPLWAAEAYSTSGDATQEEPTVEEAASARQPQQAGTEDIVVTAQRREERLQDVPIAVSVVTASAAARQGVTSTESLGIAVPTLQFSRQVANGGVPFLRGVGSPSATVGSEAPVAVYIDDVYIGAPSSTLFQFNNIDSVEVLKGPQGTLFGRNATGGVVHIHTKGPSQGPSYIGTVGYGSFDTYYGSAYVNAPLSSDAAMNISAIGRKQSKGYGRSVATGQDIYKSQNYGVRSQLAWTPGSNTEVMLAADYSWAKGDIGLNVGLAPGSLAIGGGTYTGNYRSLANPTDFSRSEDWGASVKVEHMFGEYMARSISAHRQSDLKFLLDSDGSLPGGPALISTSVDAFVKTSSQELQLLSPSGNRLKWILGGFYLNAYAGYNPITTSGLFFGGVGGFSGADTKQWLNSYAAFAEGSYELLPSTTLTAGVRYTIDRYRNSVRLLNGLSPVVSPSPFQQSESFSKLTYRTILDRKLTDDILGYLSYSRGFKSGGYNLGTPTTIVNGKVVPAGPVRPEVLDAYEIGVKSDLFDRVVRLNIALYRYDYSDLQVVQVLDGTPFTVNAAKARINGIDVDYSIVPNSRINFSGGVSILDSKFTSFPNGPRYVPNPAVCTPAPQTIGPLTGGNRVCSVDLAGNRTTRAPKLTFTASATYTLPTDAGDFAINGTWYHNSGYFWEPDNRLRQPQYDLVNAMLSWASPSGRYEVRAYARNLLNEYYLTYASETTGRDAITPDMPRNFGVEATLKL